MMTTATETAGEGARRAASAYTGMTEQATRILEEAKARGVDGADLVDDAGRLERKAVDHAARDHHAARLSRGLEAADTDWYRPVAAEWMKAMETGKATLSADALLRIAVGLREGLAVRDAMLVSILSPGVDEDLMLELAANPHGRRSVEAVGDALTSMFRNPSARPDPRRCATGLGLLGIMHRAFEPHEDAQVLAITAYVCWWLGLCDEAGRGARAALEEDPACSLASIILTGVEFHMPPAWADPRHAKRKATR